MSHLTSPVNECNTTPENSMAKTRLQCLGVITSAILPENNPKKFPNTFYWKIRKKKIVTRLVTTPRS